MHYFYLHSSLPHLDRYFGKCSQHNTVGGGEAVVSLHPERVQYNGVDGSNLGDTVCWGGLGFDYGHSDKQELSLIIGIGLLLTGPKSEMDTAPLMEGDKGHLQERSDPLWYPGDHN
ncbi:hypothetical protein IW261DRAFT_1424001 [Armillaria novae-zelandiae]|uniref:Uncharacterized protein n=1 Tax=Armillaria novae-zelandiae TaxID=153914 RepID=A0AA39UBQ3_9AGAR|nr:hypothetical protein IW261DRAFT_1424001 [Armillaria novae-zelandiae]